MGKIDVNAKMGFTSLSISHLLGREKVNWILFCLTRKSIWSLAQWVELVGLKEPVTTVSSSKQFNPLSVFPQFQILQEGILL